MTSWCLLFVCAFLVSVALTEQMNLLLETSSQDEQTLSDVASVLKTKKQPYQSWLNSSVTAGASTLSCLAAPDEPLWAHDATGLELPALCLHQRLSVYRI